MVVAEQFAIEVVSFAIAVLVMVEVQKYLKRAFLRSLDRLIEEAPPLSFAAAPDGVVWPLVGTLEGRTTEPRIRSRAQPSLIVTDLTGEQPA